MSGVSLKFNAQDALSKLWDAREELTRPAPLLNKMGERLLEFTSCASKSKSRLRALNGMRLSHDISDKSGEIKIRSSLVMAICETPCDGR